MLKGVDRSISSTCWEIKGGVVVLMEGGGGGSLVSFLRSSKSRCDIKSDFFTFHSLYQSPHSWRCYTVVREIGSRVVIIFITSPYNYEPLMKCKGSFKRKSTTLTCTILLFYFHFFSYIGWREETTRGRRNPLQKTTWRTSASWSPAQRGIYIYLHLLRWIELQLFFSYLRD